MHQTKREKYEEVFHNPQIILKIQHLCFSYDVNEYF